MGYQRGFTSAAFVVCAAMVVGCGKSDDKKPATQVAAKVNSEEITVHQVNNVLARNPNIPADAAPRAKREIVERLIDQELARQRAVEKKLDRSPQVVQAIEAAKSEILARAYLQQVASAQSKPTPDEVKKYYAEHPELFSERRLYVLEEIALAPSESIVKELRAKVAKARSMQEVGEWLKAREVQYMVNRGGRAAEQIPLEMLPRLNRMKDGEMQVMEVGDRVNVVRVVASKPAPVDEAAAAPRIQQFLYNKRSNEVVAEEVKRLKGEAKIEYAGEFSGAAAAAPAKAEAPKAEAAAPNVEKAVRGLR
ncbi:MAG TPA: EpsD family peptidyl-prolyl cis-trans isomerase [Burkholderiales bacterium]|nr:EpsD family peptidyl-prolyl cis-trans isomerase [Burkholderiales bacterium]